MQREIKFRAWDEGQMIPLDEIELCELEYPVMQFTGLKDKNGVEIYEGDIVQNSAKVLWEIAWDDGKAKWSYSRGGHAAQPYARTSFGMSYVQASKMEIIGNIYQNPELLTNESQPS